MEQFSRNDRTFNVYIWQGHEIVDRDNCYIWEPVMKTREFTAFVEPGIASVINELFKNAEPNGTYESPEGEYDCSIAVRRYGIENRHGSCGSCGSKLYSTSLICSQCGRKNDIIGSVILVLAYHQNTGTIIEHVRLMMSSQNGKYSCSIYRL